MFSGKFVIRSAIAAAFIASIHPGLLLAAGNGQASKESKTYSLISMRKPGELTRVKTVLEVQGHLHFSSDGKPTKIPLKVSGNMLYEQRLIEIAGPTSATARAIRHYIQADAAITVNKKAVPKRSLSEDRRLIGVESKDHHTILFSPQGTLQRDDLDLITLPADSLLVAGLLPSKPVAIGEHWKTSTKILAQLLGMDEAHSVKIESILKTVKSNIAGIETSGTLEGTTDGASTKIRLRAKTNFDLNTHRITGFAISIHEKRGVSPVAPGVDAVSKLGMRITPISESAKLTSRALVGLTLRTDDPLRKLRHRSAQGHFMLDHRRNWHVVSDDRKLSVLRLLDDGKLIAQLNISPLPEKQPGRTISLDQFKQDIRTSLDKNFGQFTNVSQQANAQDYRVYRVEATGQTSELPIHWIYYYISDKHGRSVALSFTLDSKLVEQFGGADNPLVESLRLLERPVPTAAKVKDDSVKKK